MLSITWRTFCTNSLMILNLNLFSWSWPKAQKSPLDLRFLSVGWSLVSTKVIVAQFQIIQTKVGDCWSMFWRWFVFFCYNDDLLFHPGPDMTTHSVVGQLEGSTHIFPSIVFSETSICITYNRYLPVMSRNPHVFRVVSSCSRCVAFPTKFTYSGNFL